VTAMKRAFLFLLLLSACGPDEEEPECAPTTVADGEARGSLVLARPDGTDSYAERVSISEADELVLAFDSFSVFVALPPEPGSYALADLDAELCSSRWSDCERLTGTIEVRSAARASFDASLRVDGQEGVRDGIVIEGDARVRFEERVEQTCRLPAHGGGGCGRLPGSGSMMN